MGLVTILGGFCSIVISLLLYWYFESFGIKDLNNTFGALFVIGPVEETSKLISMILAVFFIRKEITEPTDGMIYMSCVALGFSVIENYFYVSGSTSPIQTMVLRLVMSTPMHITFSALMGLAVFSLLENKKGWSFLLISLLYASTIHGIYDLIAFNKLPTALLLFMMKITQSWALSFLEYSTAISPYRISLKEFIEKYESPIEQDGIECLHCGDNNKKTTYTLGRITIQKCHNCSSYVASKDSLFRLFHHFGSTFKNLSSYYGRAEEPNNNLSTIYAANYISDDKKIGYFDLEYLNTVLEKFTINAVAEAPNFISSVIKPPESMRAVLEKIAQTKKQNKLKVELRKRKEERENSKATLPPETTTIQTASVIRELQENVPDSAEITVQRDLIKDEDLERIPRTKFFSQKTFFNFLLYPLEGAKTPKPIYVPSERGPLWNWGAFIIPEFWFLWHEIWGACSLVLLTEGILLYTLMPYLGFKHSVLITLVAIRLAAALLGHRIYYYRNGRWVS